MSQNWNPLKVDRRFMSPQEMFASQVVPTNSAQSRACGASMLVRSGASERAQVRMAGNSMHVPCVGAFLIAACMMLETVD